MHKNDIKQLENDLWSSADTLRANSDLKASEYSTPVLGLIFLKFADNKYSQFETEILEEYQCLQGGRRERSLSEIAIEKCGFYLPDHARYDYLLNLPEENDIAKAIKEAMQAIEQYKPELKDTLPQDEYFRLTRTDSSIPKTLLKNFSTIPSTADGDLFGRIYEYFLGQFALKEGQGGGEFFTPRSVVQLMVEIIEPSSGTVFDPACGSGGMFVQSANFRQDHKIENDQGFFVYGQEKNSETVKLAKMNLAVNGIRGDVRQAISYYEDHFDSLNKFDYVLANPPFNVKDVVLERVKDDERFSTYGVPQNKSKSKKNAEDETIPNANYLWINLFATSLNEKGRAGLVMANSASDARHSEADIRKTLIQENLVYAMLTLPNKMFYTVSLPATLWFFDKAKTTDDILFIDARNVYTPIDRKHREFSEPQFLNLATISHLYRGQCEAFTSRIDDYFSKGMASLDKNQPKVVEVSEQLVHILTDEQGKAAAEQLQQAWNALDDLKQQVETYRAQTHSDIDTHNTAQRELRRVFDPFFEILHASLKQLDKTFRQSEKEQGKANKLSKDFKNALEQLHIEMKEAESYFKHISWLQERFPEARYEDVTGLCKVATPEEVAEQDYSLNPGRYVGVVIEEDGKTEEEFITEILALNDELEELNSEARKLEGLISQNIFEITGEQ